MGLLVDVGTEVCASDFQIVKRAVDMEPEGVEACVRLNCRLPWTKKL